MTNQRHRLYWKICHHEQAHDDVIKRKHFPCYWPFVRGVHWSPVNSPHKGQWGGALMFSLICDWINGWVIYNIPEIHLDSSASVLKRPADRIRLKHLPHRDGLVQEKRNSSALAMELHLSCTNPSISSAYVSNGHYYNYQLWCLLHLSLELPTLASPASQPLSTQWSSDTLNIIV